MQNLRFPTRMGYLFIFLFLLDIVSLAVGYFTNNYWFVLHAILLSFIQYYMYGELARQHARYLGWMFGLPPVKIWGLVFFVNFFWRQMLFIKHQYHER